MKYVIKALTLAPQQNTKRTKQYPSILKLEIPKKEKWQLGKTPNTPCRKTSVNLDSNNSVIEQLRQKSTPSRTANTIGWRAWRQLHTAYDVSRDSTPIYVGMFIFSSVQLNEILKEEWSIDDELVPRIDKHEDAQRGDDRQNDQTSTSKWMCKIPRPATSYPDSTTTEKNVIARSQYQDRRCPQVNVERHKREATRQRILKTARGGHTYQKTTSNIISTIKLFDQKQVISKSLDGAILFSMFTNMIHIEC